MVADAAHLLDDLGELPLAGVGDAAAAAAGEPTLPDDEAAVLAALGADESAIDRIIEGCGLPPQVVAATLLKLEMRRLVRVLPGFRYVRR